MTPEVLRAEARRHREAARRLRLALRAERDLVQWLRLKSWIGERVALAKRCDAQAKAAA